MYLCCVRLNKCALFSNKCNGMASIKITDNSVGIVVYGLDDHKTVIPFPAGAEIFPFFTVTIQPSSEVHPFSYPVGISDRTLGLKWQEHGVDSSHPSSAKIKNA